MLTHAWVDISPDDRSVIRHAGCKVNDIGWHRDLITRPGDLHCL